MKLATRTIALALPMVTAVLLSGGCVRRTARFNTVPDGARLFLNQREIGRTPATVEFNWYGDYDVVYRLDGFETAKTHVRIAAPWYQRFPLDFFAEIVWPGELLDHHDIAAYELTPMQQPAREQLVNRAIEFRSQTLFEGGPISDPAQPPPTMQPDATAAPPTFHEPVEPAEAEASDAASDS